MNKQPLLSICIPTYNREKFLQKNLDSLAQQLKPIEDELVEVIVSDNCSPDDTPRVVKKFIEKGLNINYTRNKENIGSDRNFLQCMHLAKGKYILLLGDDDILLPGVVGKIINKLKEEDWGLLHIKNRKGEETSNVYTDVDNLFKDINVWITFMSGNIFRRSIVDNVQVTDEMLHSCLLQVPFFIESALNYPKNCIYKLSLFSDENDSANNGNYNLFQVFTNNLLEIWEGYNNKGAIKNETFRYLRKNSLHFVNGYIWRTLFLKNKTNFKTQNAWHYLFQWYWMLPEFYLRIIYFSIKKIIVKIVKHKS